MLAWAVLEREDEIFEDDEVKDEYKVMHALWARWIFLNRSVNSASSSTQSPINFCYHLQNSIPR